MKNCEVLSSLSDTQQNFRSETDSNISVVTGNDPGESPSFDSSHMRTSDIADAPKCTKIVNIYQSPTENHQYEKLINIKLMQII
jgi:hypothetical protein